MRFSRSIALASLAAATLPVSAHAQSANAGFDRAALESFIRGEEIDTPNIGTGVDPDHR